MKKVLIVEDSATLSAVLRMRLEDAGFLVDSVAGGYELLAYLKKSAEPDAVILDLFIPEKSGIELLDTIVNKWTAAAIFIYSAQVSWKARLSAYPAVCRFFTKEDDMKDLIAAVREKLGTGEAGSGTEEQE